MSTKIKSINECLEELEISKIAEEYPATDYIVIKDKRIKGLVLDLYVEHKCTGEKTVFEVKAKQKLNKNSIKGIVEQRNLIKKVIPGVKFILVLAKKFEIAEVLPSDFNIILENYISNNKKISLSIKEIIPEYNVKQIHAVTMIELTRIDFNNFSKINLTGYGFFVYWSLTLNGDRREMINKEGIPFQFNVELVFDEQHPLKYQIKEGAQISFDFSEYKTEL
jgi:hypothetical protein